jgi:hypothetical protein
MTYDVDEKSEKSCLENCFNFFFLNIFSTVIFKKAQNGGVASAGKFQASVV